MRAAVLCCFVNIFAFSNAFPNLYETLSANANTTTLKSLVDQAGLADTLKTQGPFTVLAPVNAAFGKIPKDVVDSLVQDPTGALSNTLLYHVLNGEIFSWDLKTGERANSANGHVIRIYSNAKGFYFNQAFVVAGEIQASNGVIYLIDEVLNVPEGTIMDILSNQDYNISMFRDYVEKVKYGPQLNSTKSTTRYTVFAPSNAAFMSLPAAAKATIERSPTYLRSLIQYHIHSGTLHAASLTNDGSISTLHTGHYIGLEHDQNTAEPLLNHIAHVNIADIEAENGVVHVISHVLIPSSVANIIG